MFHPTIIIILPIFCRQLGSKRNPSWSEITHFVTFLSTQLDDCERSVFCMADITADVLPKFKEFVITPMLQMSEVWLVATCTLYVR